MKTGKIHAANADTSKRPLRVLGVLADRKKHSTLSIISRARVCAVSSIVSELRSSGHRIDCERVGFKNPVWSYQLRGGA